MKEGRITLTQKQLKRLKVMNAYIDGNIDRKRASELLSLSERQISRLKKGLITEGEAFHAIPSELKEKILKEYYLPEHQNINFLHFKQVLAEDHDICIS